jgi:hypothetical protein
VMTSNENNSRSTSRPIDFALDYFDDCTSNSNFSGGPMRSGNVNRKSRSTNAPYYRR